MTSNYKNSMYPRNFLCEEAKIKQRTPLKKQLRIIGEETIWESRFTSFFLFRMIQWWAAVITTKPFFLDPSQICYIPRISRYLVIKNL